MPWSKAASEEWKKLDTDLVPIFESLRGSPLLKMDTYPELVYKFPEVPGEDPHG